MSSPRIEKHGGMIIYPSVSEQIMERFMRLDPTACIRMRDRFPPGPDRWYVSLGRVQLTSPQGGGFSPGASGRSPEEAIEKTWAVVLEYTVKCQDAFFLRFNCKPYVPIPGDDPQVWVRWSEEKDDWIDVQPTAEMLQVRHIPADRVRKLAKQQCYDRD